MRSIDIWRVRDGRFIEHWDELNWVTLITAHALLLTLTVVCLLGAGFTQ